MSDEEFTEVFRIEQSRLVDLGYLLCGDRATAEDAVIESAAKVLVRWRRGRVNNLPAYLRKALVNEIRSQHRQRARRTRRDDGWASEHPPVVDDAADVVVSAGQGMAWLTQLPSGQRAVVALRFFDDRSASETAEVLGISTGTVKSQTAKALNTLRGLMEEIRDE